MKSALTRYRVLAYATGVFLLLLSVNLILKYVVKTEHHLGSWLAIVHGWLYLAYVVVAADLWFRSGLEGTRERLPVRQTILVLLAGTIPFMSFVAERWVSRQPQFHQVAAGRLGE